MPRPAIRFVFACLLFAGWLGYLVHLATTSAQPVVSRPQLLVADVVVIAQVDGTDQPVVIKEVLFVREGLKAPAVGDRLSVPNLGDCRRPAREDQKPQDLPLDWTGAGEYLLPLRPIGAGEAYLVVEVPPSPGFAASRMTPRLYPVSADVRSQYRSIKGN